MSAEIRTTGAAPSVEPSSPPPFGTLLPWLRSFALGQAELVREALRELLNAESTDAPRCDLGALDRRIMAIDRALSAHLDALLHHPKIQALERRWRGLAFVLDRVATADGVRVEVLSASPDDLRTDFAESLELSGSGLYRLVHTRALGTYGAPPYGLLCGDFSSGSGRDDLDLLRSIGRVCAASQVPFIGNAKTTLLGVSDYAELAGLADVEASIDGATGQHWRALRSDPNARYIGLCLPRFLLRAPIDVDREPAAQLRYRERIRDDRDRLWGHASLALTVRVAEAFARYRWCVSILGSRLCEVIHADPPQLRSACSVDLLVSRRLEGVLASAGFIAMTYDRRARGLTFHAAPSLALPANATATEEFNTQLAYTLLSGRVAHYLRRIERDVVGSWDDPRKLESALRSWLRGHVADLEDAHWETRARRPIRRADLSVRRAPGGWVRVRLEIEPHFTHHGAPIILTTQCRLDPAHTPELDDVDIP